ncbi:AI-2E family transporter [Vibrio breoganii]|uniref:AI-2E family transporter n=1 Tax=Vibrio breoganii TaxID=553239 RepID=UPI000C83B0EF|nr:AI-2E family transporter [Vibrio breoganii]PML12735.1 hypothetical protein BCT84_02300 [Vibrio breoganii]
MNLKNLKTEHYFLIFWLKIAMLFCVALIFPFIHSLVIAFLLSLVAQPLHGKLTKKFGTNMSALVICIATTLLIWTPLVFTSLIISKQAFTTSHDIYQWTVSSGLQNVISADWSQTHLEWLNEYVLLERLTIQDINQHILTYSASISSKALQYGGTLLANLTNAVIAFLIMIFVLFFFLRDHERIITNIKTLVVLPEGQQQLLLTQTKDVSKTIIFGTLATALLQGFAGGVGMYAVGFQGLLWGAIISVASLIPILGTSIVLIPAILFLLLTQDYSGALLLTVWSLGVVGAIDNLVRPLLMRGAGHMNTMMVLLSILGGVHIFGLIGLVYGPLIFTLAIVLFRLYAIEVAPRLTSNPLS